ncbi:hypothetical protein ABMA28_009778 [Loxostege sticticalis]|uniref:beta-N-acetylhexosaminidase n=1 Tax=Loxostege sticticalis TaxID=481309 RepID=A0ABD0SBE3_LOXSC
MRFCCKVRTCRKKIFTIAILIIGLYLFLSYNLLPIWFGNTITEDLEIQKHIGELPPRVRVSLNYVVMHIDLKRTPLNLAYLESLLPFLKEHGVNSLLMEYEDMFPYEGKLLNLSAENCYKKPDLKRFLSTAIGSGFEIIPLVQTFGHLEYALKLSEFQHLREMPLYPDSICPSKEESMAFLKHLLEQVMDFHNAISPLKHIHIGCNELYHVNKCEHCKKRGLEETHIFLHHVKNLSDVIKSQYPDTTVLIWDDMLRGIKPKEWDHIDKFTKVEPVYWESGAYPLVSHSNLFMYHMKFPHIWIASAFKGADGRTATFPDLGIRYQNVFNWMNFIINYNSGGGEQKIKFRGIIITGCSRYSHMDPPCELLPISIPSLVLNLLVVRRFKSGVDEILQEDDDPRDSNEVFLYKYLKKEVVKSMQCNLDIDSVDSSGCVFDGMELSGVFKSLTNLFHDLKSMFNDNELSLESVEFYSQFDLINKNTVAYNIEKLNNYLKQIGDLEYKAVLEMSQYYKRDFVNEYINYKTFHIKKKLQRLINIYKTYKNVSVWRRTPINFTSL